MKRPLPFLLTLSSLFVVGSNGARAELIPFSYSWTFTPDVVGDPKGLHLSFSRLPSGTTSVLPGDYFFLGGGVYQAGPQGAEPIPIHAVVNYDLRLTDLASNRSGDIRFTTTFDGILSAADDNAVTVTMSRDLFSLRLGQHVYSLWVGYPYGGDPPDPFSRGFATFITPVQVPEPSALMLGSAGALGLAACRWLRRRRVRLAASTVG
jgi:hypothetical protein